MGWVYGSFARVFIEDTRYTHINRKIRNQNRWRQTSRRIKIVYHSKSDISVPKITNGTEHSHTQTIHTNFDSEAKSVGHEKSVAKEKGEKKEVKLHGDENAVWKIPMW